MEKLTKRDHFNALLAIEAVASNEDLRAFVEHELELLAKKNAARSNAPTETQLENAEHAKNIVAWMGDKEVTISMVRAHFGFSPQKATPLMNDLVKAGKVVKRVEKRVSYFKVA